MESRAGGRYSNSEQRLLAVDDSTHGARGASPLYSQLVMDEVPREEKTAPPKRSEGGRGERSPHENSFRLHFLDPRKLRPKILGEAL
jgi:hypothetical protein